MTPKPKEEISTFWEEGGIDVFWGEAVWQIRNERGEILNVTKKTADLMLLKLESAP